MEIGFSALSIGEPWTTKLKELGITEPTEVQSAAIPVLLEGRDAVVRSLTGTGKTLAYLLPILQRLDAAVPDLQALVLAPTRELCVQIADELRKLIQGTPVRSASLIGGASLRRQIEQLRAHPHVAIGTPGRALELIRLRKLKMHKVKTIILDEADELMATGGAEDAHAVIRSALRDRQLAVFSATAGDPGPVAEWLRDPVRIDLTDGLKLPPSIRHWVIACGERKRSETLIKVLRACKPTAALVFVTDADQIGVVEAKLRYAGFSVASLYGEADKLTRTKVMNAFRDGRLRLLVCTDVAARGLDFPEVSHVIHVQPASGADQYVHRAGRTGRMGRPGVSISIVTPRERFIIGKFARALGFRPEPKTLSYGRIVDVRESDGPRRRTSKKAPNQGKKH